MIQSKKKTNTACSACDTFCINRDPMSLAKATVVKKGDVVDEGLAQATTAVLDGDCGGSPSPEFSESERWVMLRFGDFECKSKSP